ncbi:MAG: excinuclease ABC subunit UvrA, partial [Candidatus Heimdallarchaeota archaeon]
TLQDVGLGYIKLGQSSTTLSGGEAQRIKISRELSKKATGRTMYLLEEPTVGLHSFDISNLLTVLNRLVDAGNTIVVVEHNLDIIKCSDWVIDLGPEGGEFGGEIIAQGTPETLAKNMKSYTGQALKNALDASLLIKPSTKGNGLIESTKARTVITGASGSGKSSLALDTIFAEGQRRFVESLSTYARQFLGRMDSADVEK